MPLLKSAKFAPVHTFYQAKGGGAQSLSPD
jgi:hypothetical protein